MNTLPALHVEPLARSYDEISEAGEVTPYSTLFRSDAQLTEVLGIALEASPPTGLFRVISAGCSFGAEIDSVLGTIQYNSPRPTAVLGVDTNPEAVQAARSGQYQLTTSLATYRRKYREAGIDFDQAMQRMNFTLHPDQHNPGLHTLATTDLRRKHFVQVEEANLTQGLPTQKLAQVVLCNNVLFHLDPETADNITSDLSEHVAPGGVLSLGANPAQTGMESNKGTDYLTWLQQIGTKLLEQDMEPVLFSQNVAFAFRRN